MYKPETVDQKIARWEKEVIALNIIIAQTQNKKKVAEAEATVPTEALAKTEANTETESVSPVETPSDSAPVDEDKTEAVDEEE